MQRQGADGLRMQQKEHAHTHTKTQTHTLTLKRLDQEEFAETFSIQVIKNIQCKSIQNVFE